MKKKQTLKKGKKGEDNFGLNKIKILQEKEQKRE
jgi:hypothetical protein